MAQEVGLLFTLGPEADGIRQGVHGLSVAANEGTAKVDVLDLVFLQLHKRIVLLTRLYIEHVSDIERSHLPSLKSSTSPRKTSTFAVFLELIPELTQVELVIARPLPLFSTYSLLSIIINVSL